MANTCIELLKITSCVSTCALDVRTKSLKSPLLSDFQQSAPYSTVTGLCQMIEKLTFANVVQPTEVGWVTVVEARATAWQVCRA